MSDLIQKRLKSAHEYPIMDDLSRIISSISKNKSVVAIVLFGSRARGTAKPISDTDIAVIFDKCTKEDVYRTEASSSRNLDVLAFNCLPSLMKYSIVREHKVLFVRNKANLRHIFMRAIHEYREHEPLYRAFGVSS